MHEHYFNSLKRILTILAGVLILKVTASAIWNYRLYLPPDFGSEFLRGREHYFFGAYQWAFYTHIGSGPFSLILGLILVNESIRNRFPGWHRCLGRVQVASVFFLVAPSGLWMSFHAAAGPIAAMGLAALAIATGTTVALGAQCAIQRRFADHRRWMTRCFLLLCSAVVLRLFGGLATVMEVTEPWVDPLATWLSWLVPLLAFELREALTRWPGRSWTRSASNSPPRWRGNSSGHPRDCVPVARSQ
jgi:hypothetical protein